MNKKRKAKERFVPVFTSPLWDLFDRGASDASAPTRKPGGGSLTGGSVDGDPASVRAREIVCELLRRHDIWVYRTTDGDGWGWADFWQLSRPSPPAEAQALLTELASLSADAAASAAFVPPVAGDIVELPVGGEGVIEKVDLPVQSAVRLPRGDVLYCRPHPLVLCPAGAGRWKLLLPPASFG